MEESLNMESTETAVVRKDFLDLTDWSEAFSAPDGLPDCFVRRKALATKWMHLAQVLFGMSGKNSFPEGSQHYWETWVSFTYPATHRDRALDTTRGNLRGFDLEGRARVAIFRSYTRTGVPRPGKYLDGRK